MCSQRVLSITLYLLLCAGQSDDEWATYFDMYKAFPEYQRVNRGMSLEEFKVKKAVAGSAGERTLTVFSLSLLLLRRPYTSGRCALRAFCKAS